jgi:hypothetical protein
VKRIAFAMLIVSFAASAHVGSEDAILEGAAGPYTLLVNVRPPQVIPGLAEVIVTVPAGDVQRVSVVALPLTGPGAAIEPQPEEAEPLVGALHAFHATPWLMAPGEWQVRIRASGNAGSGELRVPVPALPLRTNAMALPRGLLLSLLALLLCLGAGGIAAASARVRGRSPRRAAWIAAAAVMVAIAGEVAWWRIAARRVQRSSYRPVEMSAAARDGKLHLALRDSGWLGREPIDLMPDHGHLMHLFAVRLPDLDEIAHLHPATAGGGDFVQPLSLGPGRWRLFADVVHDDGLAETAVADLTIDPAAIDPPGLGPDDAQAVAPKIGRPRREAPLASGGKVVRLDEDPLRAGPLPTLLRFAVLESSGEPSRDVAPYMGMAAHAALLRDDLSLFAHLHPTGSVPMASLAVAGVGSAHHHGAMSAEIAIPYAFERPGAYRLFLQFRRRGRVETAAFDLDVR